MASKRLSPARFEILDAKTAPKLPAGVTPLSPVLRLLPHERRFQEPVMLLLPITGEIGVEAAKGWRSKPCGKWELLAPEVIKHKGVVMHYFDHGSLSTDLINLKLINPSKETSFLRFWLEHFCNIFAGVANDETSVLPPPPPCPPAEDVKFGGWPLVESASRFSCCLRWSTSEAPFRTVIIRIQRKYAFQD